MARHMSLSGLWKQKVVAMVFQVRMLTLQCCYGVKINLRSVWSCLVELSERIYWQLIVLIG